MEEAEVKLLITARALACMATTLANQYATDQSLHPLRQFGDKTIVDRFENIEQANIS